MKNAIGILLLSLLPSFANAQGYVGYVPGSYCGTILIERNGKSAACQGETPLYLNDRVSCPNLGIDESSLFHLRPDVQLVFDSSNSFATLELKPTERTGILSRLSDCASYIFNSLFIPDYNQTEASTKGLLPSSSNHENYPGIVFPPEGSSVGMKDNVTLRWKKGQFQTILIGDWKHGILQEAASNRDSLSITQLIVKYRQAGNVPIAFVAHQDTEQIRLRILSKVWENRIHYASKKIVWPIEIKNLNLRLAATDQAISDASNGAVNLYWKSYELASPSGHLTNAELAFRQKLIDRFSSYASKVASPVSKY